MFHTKHRPYLILKWAQSADDFIALNEPKQFWLTNNESKKLTHKWRSEEPGTLVGRNTVEIDDCELNVRLWEGLNPARIVLDKKLSLSPDKKIFNAEAKTIVFNEAEDSAHNSVVRKKIDFSSNVLQQVLNVLYQMEIQSVIIEGGPTTLNHFIEQNLWDEARIFTSKRELKEGKHAPKISRRLIEETDIEGDNLKILFNTAS